jgi:hypothetical protein
MRLVLAPVGGGAAMVRIAAGADFSFPRSNSGAHSGVRGCQIVGGTSRVDDCCRCWLNAAGRGWCGCWSGGGEVCRGDDQETSGCVGGLAAVWPQTPLKVVGMVEVV